MKKKIKIIITCIVVFILIFIGIMFMNHNKYADYFNPFIKETVSYGQVPTNTQNYQNIEVYTPSDKNKEIINQFTGYAHEPYVKIYHKGQYVKFIEYISKNSYNKALKK